MEKSEKNNQEKATNERPLKSTERGKNIATFNNSEEFSDRDIVTFNHKRRKSLGVKDLSLFLDLSVVIYIHCLFYSANNLFFNRAIR